MRKMLAVVMIAVLGWTVLNWHLERPFVGHHAMNGAQFGIMARNHLSYGLLTTRLGQVENVDRATPDQFAYSAHHPFLYPVMLAGAFRVFGESEWSARFLSVVLTILAAVMMYRLAGEIWGDMTGLLAAGLWLLTPMVIHFGKMPVHEPVVMVFILLAVNQYWLWWNLGGDKHLLLSAGWGLIACLIAWPAFYVMPILVGHAWLTKPGLRWKSLGLLVAPMVAMGWHLVHTRWLTGSWTGGGLAGVFLGRILRQGMEETGVRLPAMGTGEFWRLQFNWVRSYYTPGLLVLVVIWGVGFLFRVVVGRWVSLAGPAPGFPPVSAPPVEGAENEQLGVGVRANGSPSTRVTRFLRGFTKYGGELLLVGLLVLGWAHIVINPSGATNHEYMLYYLGPFMVISGAVVLGKIYKWLPRRLWLGLVAGLVVWMVVGGKNFLQPLEAAEFHRPGYELGMILGWELALGEKAIIASTQFQSFFGHLVKYYSDRVVESGDFGPGAVPSLRGEYKFIVVPESHLPVNEELAGYLDKNYSMLEMNGFRLYEIGNLKTQISNVKTTSEIY
jgi:4-amino-4-deoxy-L-arabinose transferase-like glycosyltransferase